MPTLQLHLDETSSVFVEVQQTGRFEDVSGTNLEANFSKVSASLAAIVESMERQLGRLPRRPDKVTLEMGAQLKGQADLWLVSGEATAHLKVTMTWDAPRAAV